MILNLSGIGVFGMSALTAVTAQNTLGVQDVFPLTAEMVRKQIESVGDDIKVDALKQGCCLMPR